MKISLVWNQSFQQRLRSFSAFLLTTAKTLAAISEYFHNPNGKRKLFKVTRVLMRTAMETERTLYLHQLLRMNFD